MRVRADLGARVALGDPLERSGDTRREERLTTLTRVAEECVHGMPAHARDRIVERAQDVGNGSRVGMLIQELEAAPTNHGTRMGEAPDEGVDLLGGKRLPSVLPCTAAA
jgi:hypothetical protein